MMTIAKEYAKLAQESKDIHGYVLLSIFRSAGSQAIGGHKTDSGYHYEFHDGSWLDVDVRKNELTEIQHA